MGATLYFRANDGASGNELWVSTFNGQLVSYEVDGSGDTFRVGPSRNRAMVSPPDGEGSHYDLHPDGERLLQGGVDPEFRAEVSFLHLVTDWKRGLMR